MAKSVEVRKIDMLVRPLLSKMPRIRPRKNASSIRGTAIAAPRIFVRENQLMAKRSEKMWSASKSAPQQSRGSAAKRNPPARSRDQCRFRFSARPSRLRRRIERNNGQSKRTAATRSARWKKVSKSKLPRKESKPCAASDCAVQNRTGASSAPRKMVAAK